MTKLLRYACMLLFLAFMPVLTNAQCTVNAGSNIDKCVFSMDSVQLHGTVAGNFTVYNWTSTGSGLVGANTTLNAYYKYNQADIANGSATLTLTVSGGTCGSVSSQVTINLYKRPTVVAQDEFTFCGSVIPLTSTVTGASSVLWRTMSGTGTFSSTTTSNTVYSTSVADRTQGFVLVEVKGSTALAGCFHQDTVRVNIVSVAIVDAGPDRVVCKHPHAAVFPIPNQTTGYTSYLWTTTGTGTFLNPNAFSTAYYLSAADQLAGSITITLTGSSATCGTASDSYTITVLPTPIVSAGTDQTICGNTVTLNGTATPSAGATIQWFTVIGDGTFSNAAILAPVYTASAADQARGYALVRLYVTSSNACVSEDTVRLDFVGSASLNAGADQIICTTPATMFASSAATATSGYTSYLWTTSGTGTFANATALLSPYIFSPADIDAGSVTLTLTGNSGTCGTTTDSRIVTIKSSPTVSAGSDQSSCGIDIALYGTVYPSAGTTYEWFSEIGTGTLTGASTTLTPVYTLSDDDKTKAYVLFRLRATSSNGCAQEDTVALFIGPAPIVLAGSNQNYCNGSVQLTGYAIHATFYKTWTTSGTGTFADTHKDSTIYMPSVADKNLPSITLTYTAIGCKSVSNSMKINFLQSATLVNGGGDESVCGRDTIQLLGTVQNAAGGTWTTTGTGRFLLSSSHLANFYEFSTADKSAGTVTLTLTSYSGSGCSSVSDVKTVTITPGSLPGVYAGPDQTSSITTQLNAIVSNAISQFWQTSGNGVFTPSSTSVNASYIPSANDIAAGSVVLKLVATNSCGTASDALTLYTVVPASISGTVKAGASTLDRGIVYLSTIGDFGGPRLIAVDTIKQADNGVYEFPSVPNGNYTIYAVPESFSTSSTVYLPTYAGSVPATYWMYAEQNISNVSANVFNISLIEYTSALPNWNTGNDTISGAVFFDPANPTPIMHRLAGTNFTTLAGVVVYLKDLNFKIIAYTSTDKYGTYSFNNVLEGNYYIYPEYSRTMDVSGTRVIAVDGNPLTIEDGNAVIKNATIIMGVFSANKTIQINAYPNPTTDKVYLELTKTGNYSVKVLDETGVVHIEQQLSLTANEVADISLVGLNKGLYIIQITSGDEVYNTKVVKF